MADHVSDWDDSWNQRSTGGKQNTIVMMIVGGVVLMFEGFLVLFLPYIIYGAGVFRPRPNPYRGKAVNLPAIFAWSDLILHNTLSGCLVWCFTSTKLNI